MKLKLYTLILFVISMIGVSCKTATKLYQQGNYDEAVELAAKKLQKNPDDQKLQDIIHNAYRFAVNDHETRISNFAQSNNELKWDWIYNEYLSLQKLYNAVYKIPAVYAILKPVDYSSYVVQYGEKAGNMHYQRGITLMNGADKKSFRDAYREFQLALRYIPGDIGIANKMNEAYEYAVTNVIVLPIQQNGGFVYSSYTIGGENVDDRLIKDLQYNSGNVFTRFYSAWDARRQNIRTDNLLSMDIIALDPGHTHDIKNMRKVSKEVVVKEIVYKPDSVVKKYAKVNAEIISTKRTIDAFAELQVMIRDENGRRVWNENIPVTYSWTTEFTIFKGDERALSEKDKQQINQEQLFPPSEKEIVRTMLDDIHQKALYRIRAYFQRY
jgi:tetratricopeptide (TPR) repeat protein